jgi:hypothetical protein
VLDKLAGVAVVVLLGLAALLGTALRTGNTVAWCGLSVFVGGVVVWGAMQRKKRLPNTRDEAVFFEYEGVAWVASTRHKPANAWQAHQNTFVRSEPFCRVCKAELCASSAMSHARSIANSNLEPHSPQLLDKQ